MPYITVKQNPKYYQMSLDDLIEHPVDISFYEENLNKKITGTRTTYREEFKKEFLDKFDFLSMRDKLIEFNERHKDLFEVKNRWDDLYIHFSIPKRNGKWRKIDAPNDKLMLALRELKSIFENDFNVLYHTSAYAYVPGRAAKDVAEYHRKHKGKWFLKLDFSDFFGSMKQDFVYKMIFQIFPFSEVVKLPEGEEALRKSLDLCFLNGSLPQGTPMSPMLTNIVMIPIDLRISNDLRKREEMDYREKDGQRNTFTYTRYSDDIQISSSRDFNYGNLIKHIKKVLRDFDAPVQLNLDKTKYGNYNGRNWILGVMLNNKNEITVGTERKQRVRAALSNYILDNINGKERTLHDVQKLNGEISYIYSIEPKWRDMIYKKYNEKYGINVEEMFKKDLNILV